MVQVFAESVIRRIDPGIGMVLSLPASAIPGHADSAQQLQVSVNLLFLLHLEPFVINYKLQELSPTN